MYWSLWDWQELQFIFQWWQRHSSSDLGSNSQDTMNLMVAGGNCQGWNPDLEFWRFMQRTGGKMSHVWFGKLMEVFWALPLVSRVLYIKYTLIIQEILIEQYLVSMCGEPQKEPNFCISKLMIFDPQELIDVQAHFFFECCCNFPIINVKN